MCRRIINSAFAVMLLCLMLLSGCTTKSAVPSDNPKHTDNTPIEEKTEVFAIKQIGDNTYINFDAGNEYPHPEFVQVGDVKFKSLAEMKNAIKNNKFTPSQAAIIKTSFPKDSNGIKICNPDKLYQPVWPNIFGENVAVYLHGESYGFLSISDCPIYASLHIHTKESYEETFERQYTNFFDYGDPKIISISDETYNKLPTKVYNYTTVSGTLRQVRYRIESNNKTLIVQETYCLNMEDETMPTSFTVPYYVELYGEENGVYFTSFIADLTSRPTIDWLLQFGVEEFKG